MPDDGYFTDDSMLRRVHRELAVALSGPRALLMQAAHPVAFEGFFAHTGALDEPYERLSRTAQVMDTIGFGSRADADRATRRVRAMHRRVRGELAEPAGRFPAGTPFAADDPELLLWVLATLVDSALVVYDKYVAPPRRRRARRLLAGLPGHRPACSGCGTHEMPDDIDAFDAYMRRHARRATTSSSRRAARELAIQIVMRPPVPLHGRPLLELVNRSPSACCRTTSGAASACRWDPVRALALHGGAEYAQARARAAARRPRLRLVSSARAA